MSTGDQDQAAKLAPALRALQDPNPYAALGRAVSYLMTKPSFANLKFGFWSKTLTGQINRKHYFLVSDGKKIVGFAGWALVDEGQAKAWLDGGADFGSGDCTNGDCMVINAWAADTDDVNQFVRRELRKHGVGLKAAFAKRFYEDGRVRPLKLATTEALSGHVEKSR